MFPTKPVHHRRNLTLKTQDSLQPGEIEKIHISTQPRGHLSHKHPSNGIRAEGPHQPRRDAHRLPNREEQLDKAIREQKLMLAGKLLRLEEKVRQKLQGDSGSSEDDGREGEEEEERPGRGRGDNGKGHTETGTSEQQRREMSKQEDNKQRKRDNWRQKEQKCGEKSRWGREDVNEYNRREGGDENVNRAWDRERTSKERTRKETNSSDDDEDEDVPQKSRETENHRAAGRKSLTDPSLPPVSSPPQLTRPQREDLMDGEGSILQLLPCAFCNRKFVPERLEKHRQVCEKVKNANRRVFNSFANRIEGTALGNYLKFHTGSQTAEGRNVRQNPAVRGRNLPQVPLPAGAREPKGSIQANAKHVTCPHCSRRFDPGPAERHIPKCRLIKSRPPPPRHRQ